MHPGNIPSVASAENSFLCHPKLGMCSDLCSPSLKGMSERLTAKLAAGETSEAEGVAQGPCWVRRCFALRKCTQQYCCGLRPCPSGVGGVVEFRIVSFFQSVDGAVLEKRLATGTLPSQTLTPQLISMSK